MSLPVAENLPLRLVSDSGSGLDIAIVVGIIIAAVVLRLLMLKRPNAMRARCPKCGTVFDIPFARGPHIGPWRYGRCPSCDKGSMMRTGIKAPLTWPEEEEKTGDHPKGPGENDSMDRRINDSRYE
jgi:hypothetical protein